MKIDGREIGFYVITHTPETDDPERGNLCDDFIVDIPIKDAETGEVRTYKVVGCSASVVCKLPRGSATSCKSEVFQVGEIVVCYTDYDREVNYPHFVCCSHQVPSNDFSSLPPCFIYIIADSNLPVLKQLRPF